MPHVPVPAGVPGISSLHDVVAKEIVEPGYLRTTPGAEPPALDALRKTA